MGQTVQIFVFVRCHYSNENNVIIVNKKDKNRNYFLQNIIELLFYIL